MSLKLLLSSLAALALAQPLHAQLGEMRRAVQGIGSVGCVLFEDFTGDGRIDLVYTSEDPDPQSGRHIVFTQQGRSKGRFGERRVIGERAVSAEDSLLLAEDADGDGDLDIWWFAYDASGSGLITLLESDGAGGFGSAMFLTCPVNDARELEVIDVDGDGLRDLVVLTSNAGSGYFRRTGSAAFATYQVFFSGAPGAPFHHSGIDLGDLDGDGDADLVIGNAPLPGVSLRGTGSYDGGSGFPINPSLLSAIVSARGAIEITLTDLDNDGSLDGISLLADDPPVELLQNQGGALVSTGPLVTSLSWQFSSEPWILVGDLDADGDDDLLTGAASGVAWLENTDSFGLEYPDPLTHSFTNKFAAVEDLDGNGLGDLVVLQPGGSFTSAQIFVLSTQETGGQIELTTSRVLNDLPASGLPAVFDANRDGLEDIVFRGAISPYSEPAQLVWKRAIGDGEFAPGLVIDHLVPGLRPPVTGDFDGDGIDDIATAAESSREISLYRGDGAGAFLPPTVALELSTAPDSIVATEMDSDGVDDLVIVRGSGASISFALGSQSGAFGPPIELPASTSFPTGFAVGDLNGDGLTDFLRTFRSSIEGFFQLPAGQFSPSVVIADLFEFSSTIWKISAPVIFDVNADGRRDVVFVNRGPAGGEVWWLEGSAGGAFSSPALLTGGIAAAYGELIPVHVDGDALVDLVINGGIFGGAPRWARNLGQGAFSPFQLASGSVSHFGRALVALDCDGDGDRDLLQTSNYSVILSMENLSSVPIGTNICGPAVPNSSGVPATIDASGSADPSANSLTLRASSLPQGQFGLFLASQSRVFVPSVPNSVGTLCLGGAIGQFSGARQIRQSGSAGIFALKVDLGSLPTPSGFVPVLAGDTWFFQSWYRDLSSIGLATSNFTNGIQVDF